jgi:hypothetical protein
MLPMLSGILLHIPLLDTVIDPSVLLFFGPVLVMLALGIVVVASLYSFGGVKSNGRAQLALALFLLLLGEAFFTALLIWPGARSDNSFLDLTLPGIWYLLIGGIVMIGGLAGAGIPMFIGTAIFLLSLGAAILPGHFISSSNDPFLSEQIYGSVLLLLSLLSLFLSLREHLWTTIKQPIQFGGVSAVLLIALLFVRGPNEWRLIPYGADILLLSWIVGTGIFLTERKAMHAAQAGQIPLTETTAPESMAESN